MALAGSALPTLYEYYTGSGITSGLNPNFTDTFQLNERNITLYSGEIHYFRVPKAYWRDRLRKLRAAGMNSVVIYVPWNLHEPQPGKFDFGSGGTDYQDLLDMEEFLKIAQEEDLFAVVRPGPYINAEYEFGGMPSWLLREDNIQVRTSDEKFMKHVRRYFNVLIPLLAALQFTKGGPIIGFQMEDEYASTGLDDKDYLRAVYNLMLDNGIVELIFTADGLGYDMEACERGGLPDVFKTRTGESMHHLVCQPDKASYLVEYWGGWFDLVTNDYHVIGVTPDTFEESVEAQILLPGSFSIYMFHGGNNFGFTNGANGGTFENKKYSPVTSSYDYDAPLNEAGDYNEKYERLVKVVKKYNKVATLTPPRPEIVPKIAYDSLKISEVLEFSSILEQVDSIQSDNVMAMEFLPINNNSGQQYGYIVYQKTGLNIEPNSVLKIEGRVCDTLMVRINDKLLTEPLVNKSQLKGFGYWHKKNGKLQLGSDGYENATLELIVENWGRNSFGFIPKAFNQKKGLWQGNVLINDEVLNDWLIYPLEFHTTWLKNLQGWKSSKSAESNYPNPTLHKAYLQVDDPKADSFIDIRPWTKGIVAVNGFVLGRYSVISPQYFLYLPAPFLKPGKNEIVFFEHFNPSDEVNFSDSLFFREEDDD